MYIASEHWRLRGSGITRARGALRILKWNMILERTQTILSNYMSWSASIALQKSSSNSFGYTPSTLLQTDWKAHMGAFVTSQYRTGSIPGMGTVDSNRRARASTSTQVRGRLRAMRAHSSWNSFA